MQRKHPLVRLKIDEDDRARREESVDIESLHGTSVGASSSSCGVSRVIAEENPALHRLGSTMMVQKCIFFSLYK